MSNTNNNNSSQSITHLTNSSTGSVNVGQLYVNGSSGQTLVYTGSSWDTVSVSSTEDKVEKIMRRSYLYKPHRTYYDESLATVINNYIDFLKAHDFKELDNVKVREPEPEVNDNEDGLSISCGNSININLPTHSHNVQVTNTGTTTVNVNGTNVTWSSPTYTQSIYQPVAHKHYVDDYVYYGNTASNLLDLLNNFLDMKDKLSNEELDTLKQLYEEIIFMENLSGE